MTDSESIEVRRKRVLYRAQHRGTHEMDLLIGGFAAARLHALDHGMLDRLEALMDHEETDLQAWLMGQRDVPLDADPELIETIRAHKLRQVGA